MTTICESSLYLNDAAFYDLDPRDHLKSDTPFFLKYASKLKGSILELACGTGRITIPLAEAGYEIWGLEFSETMLAQFKNKKKNLPKAAADRIHLIHGDMSDFSIQRKFSLIFIASRSFQLLYDVRKENACLENLYSHLTDTGYFILDIGNFVPNKAKEKEWVSDKEFFDWENLDPATGYQVRRSHKRKEIDTVKQIIYPHKTYQVTKTDGSVDKIVKRSPWKYFFVDQIKDRIQSNRFEIVEEMGHYDGRPITEESPEYLFVCRKK